jgi:hypothetical protein
MASTRIEFAICVVCEDKLEGHVQNALEWHYWQEVSETIVHELKI